MQTVNKKWLQQKLSEGFQALNQHNIPLASECCRQVLQAKPDLVQGHFLVGLIALESKDRKTAFAAFTAITKIDRNHAAAWAQLAKLLMSEGQVNRADAALKEVIRSGTQDPLVQDLLGSIYSMMGEHTLAKQWFTKANDNQPKHTGYILNLANNYVYHGEMETANDLFRDIIQLQPNSPQAHWALSAATKTTDTQHIEQMKLLLSKPGLHPRALYFYCYAIGKEYEDLQDWNSAFQAFEQGAKIRRQSVEFDEQAEITTFEFLEQNFTSDWLNNCGQGFADKAPIFVLGQPRTGTTLIERIITSHSQVHSAGELQQLGLAVRRLSQHQKPQRFSTELFSGALQIAPEKLGKMYSDTTQIARNNKPYFVDKLPQNYLFIPLILAALPNAKIVHLQRNPMDACFASYKQLFADAYLHSYDLKEMARHHARYYQLMMVWQERFPNRFFNISYEETVSELEPNARALVDYLQLPWEDACLNFHQQSQTVSTASAVQVREPAHKRSVGRWQHYSKQLEPMRQELMNHGIASSVLMAE